MLNLCRIKVMMLTTIYYKHIRDIGQLFGDQGYPSIIDFKHRSEDK